MIECCKISLDTKKVIVNKHTMFDSFGEIEVLV